MTQTIKAIETQYKGYRFRSRLEARWAVFFDALGIEWVYEPEGYEKEEGGKTLRYLPDFWLPKIGLWVEVKGNMTREEAGKLNDFLDWDCPLPKFTDSNDRIHKRYTIHSGAMLILGDIPEPGPGVPLYKLISHHEGLIADHVWFARNQFIVLTDDMCLGYAMGTGEKLIDTRESVSNDILLHFQPSKLRLQTKHYHVEAVDTALTAARSARFEHGENGSKPKPIPPQPTHAYDPFADCVPDWMIEDIEKRNKEK